MRTLRVRHEAAPWRGECSAGFRGCVRGGALSYGARICAGTVAAGKAQARAHAEKRRLRATPVSFKCLLPSTSSGEAVCPRCPPSVASTR